MNDITVLIVDDESRMRKLIKDFLMQKNYKILEAGDGEEALRIFQENEEKISVILLDVMMPKLDGWSVLRQIRQTSKVPIIMLTARGEEQDELFGFELGVDEYISKPFSPKILVARVEALLKRTRAEENGTKDYGGIIIDSKGRTVTVDGKQIEMSLREYELLKYLVDNKGIALSRDKILNNVWNYDYYGDSRTIDSHIKKIRHKLGKKGKREDGIIRPILCLNRKEIEDYCEENKLNPRIDQSNHDRIYNNRDYDYNIIIEDRIVQVAKEITDYLKATDRMSKTIVFCATEDAALRMRNELARQNPDMMQKYPDYVVRITGNDTFGKDKLDYFISVGSKTPVIATTSKLLSTGADCKMTKLIVLDEWINSMTEFKQIIGRGTRIREKDGKTYFIVMDIRGVTALFADPDWDGPIEIDEDYGREKHGPGPCPPGPKPDPDPDPVDPPYPPEEKPIVDENGCRVRIINKTVSVYDTNGKLLRQESIVDYTKTNIIGTYASLDNFIRQWTSEEKKKKIQELLASKGIDLEALKADQHMSDVDDFDFICHVAFDKKPLTRKERAIMRKDDKHLLFYVSIAKIGNNLIDVTTVVQYHNALGKIYFFFIKPFHKMIVPRVVKELI